MNLDVTGTQFEETVIQILLHAVQTSNGMVQLADANKDTSSSLIHANNAQRAQFLMDTDARLVQIIVKILTQYGMAMDVFA